MRPTPMWEICNIGDGAPRCQEESGTLASHGWLVRSQDLFVLAECSATYKSRDFPILFSRDFVMGSDFYD